MNGYFLFLVVSHKTVEIRHTKCWEIPGIRNDNFFVPRESQYSKMKWLGTYLKFLYTKCGTGKKC